MIKQEEFSYRFRSGLQGHNLKDTAIVYILNLTILLFIYIATVPWTRIEDNFFELVPVLIITLIGVEYILTTFIIERIENGESNSNESYNNAILASRSNLVQYLFETKTIPINLRTASLFFILMILFGGTYISFLEHQPPLDALRMQDNAVVITVNPDKRLADMANRKVWAIVKPENQTMYYLTPVNTTGTTWSMTIQNKRFLNLDQSFLMDFCLDPKGVYTADKLLLQAPYIDAEDIISYRVNLEKQKVQTSYTFLQH